MTTQKDKTEVLTTNGSLMKVKSIAEWSILQYFWPAYTITGLGSQFLVFFDWPLKTDFTVYWSNFPYSDSNDYKQHTIILWNTKILSS